MLCHINKMAESERLWFRCLFVCLHLCTIIVLSEGYISHNDIEEEFHRYEVIKPVISISSHSRHKRSIRINNSSIYHHSIILEYSSSSEIYILDLTLNKNLFAEDYKEQHDVIGESISFSPSYEKLNHCYYTGKARGRKDSWAAVSTCSGKISAVINDGHDTHYIEPSAHSSVDNITPHYLVKESNLKNRHFKCGYSGNSSYHSTLLRNRRLASIRPPSSSSRYSRYVELILVSDKIEFKKFGSDKDALFARSKQIGNIVNALYAPLNIYVALVAVVVWSDHDKISLSTDGDATLTNFLRYRRERLIPFRANDNAQLITGLTFDDGVVGKALKGPICTYEYSGGVNMDHSKVVGLVATTVAHELGHNFGMEHDEPSCECEASKCIMAPSSSSTRPSHWSSCSREYLHYAYEQGMDYCLHNRPKLLFGPVCGNGFLEDGEECDCGLKEYCDNYCCDPSTCKLYANASCATGMCCDLSTCQVKPVAKPCREAVSDCDLTEFCNGESEFCPDDFFKEDGTLCDNYKAHCIDGECKTHTDQCKLLWGPTGTTSDSRCYNQNIKGSVNGNCGYSLIYKNYSACAKQDIMCGMLHCTHLNEKLEFGMESAAILARSFIRVGNGKVLTCRSAIIDLGIGVIDPGLVPDGSKCGDDKMCYKQHCIDVSSVNKGCPYNCNDNGVCNNNGNCHCLIGFGPPYCDSPGPGGSDDSGPARDPSEGRHFIIVMYVLFLGIVPFMAIIACVAYYYRKKVKTWWMVKARRAAISRGRRADNNKHPVRPHPKFNGLNRASVRNMEISAPIPINGVPQTSNVAPKPQKFDRNSLKNVEISNPVLQSQTNKNLPVRPAPPKPKDTVQAVPGRTASSNGTVITGENGIPSRTSNLYRNGSTHHARPLSGPPTRPSCPPPPRPPPPYDEVMKQDHDIYNKNRCNDTANNREDNVRPASRVQSNIVAALTRRFENANGDNVNRCQTESDRK